MFCGIERYWQHAELHLPAPHDVPYGPWEAGVWKDYGTGHLGSKGGSKIRLKCSHLTLHCEEGLAGWNQTGFFSNPLSSLTHGEERLLVFLPAWHPRFPPACPGGVRSLPGAPTFLKGQETFWFFSSFHHLKYKRVLNESSIFSKLKFVLFSGCKLWPIVLFKCWVTPFSFGYPRTARKIPVFFQKPFFVLGKGQRFFKTFQILSTPRRAGGL